MKRVTETIDQRLRSTFATTTPNDERERLLQRAHTSFTNSADVGAAPRPRRTRSTRILFASVAALLVGGGAIAGGANLAERVWGDDAPVIKRVDQFEDPATKQVTPEEYRQLKEMTLVPPPDQGVGTFPDSSLVPFTDLEPGAKATVLVDNDRIGRAVAAPYADGSNFCVIWDVPAATGLNQGMHSCGFPPFGPTGLNLGTTGGFVPGTNYKEVVIGLIGIAADDVSSIRVDLDDGSTQPVLLDHNLFVWTNIKTTDLTPTRIVSTRAGGEHEILLDRHEDGLGVYQHPDPPAKKR